MNLDRRTLSLILLAVLHVGLTVVGFNTAVDRDHCGIAIGIGDCQFFLAAVFLSLTSFRWPVRYSIALLLAASGWAIQAICWINLVYPFLAAEETFITLIASGILAMSLWFAARRGIVARLFPTTDSSKRSLTFSLLDLMLWFAACAMLIILGQSTVTFADVAGMVDPWESLVFLTLAPPMETLSKLPLLLLCIGAWVIGLGWIAYIELSSRPTLQKMILVVATLALMGLMETAFGWLGYLRQEALELGAPLTSIAAVYGFLMGGRAFDGQLLWLVISVMLSRVLFITMSLKLLQLAGSPSSCTIESGSS